MNTEKTTAEPTAADDIEKVICVGLCDNMLPLMMSTSCDLSEETDTEAMTLMCGSLAMMIARHYGFLQAEYPHMADLFKQQVGAAFGDEKPAAVLVPHKGLIS